MRTWLVSTMGAVFALAFVWSVAGPATHADKVAAGATIYADYYAHCHGEQLYNTSGGVTCDL